LVSTETPNIMLSEPHKFDLTKEKNVVITNHENIFFYSGMRILQRTDYKKIKKNR